MGVKSIPSAPHTGGAGDGTDLMDTSAEADTETEVVAKRMRPAKSSYATGGKSAAASTVSPSAAVATNGSAAADKTDDTAEEVGGTCIDLGWYYSQPLQKLQ